MAIVVIVVGFSAYREYVNYNQETKARALGDQIHEALSSENASQSIDALQAIQASGPDARALVQFYLADRHLAEDNPEAALSALEDIGKIEGVDDTYNDLAALKMLILKGNAEASDEIVVELDGLMLAGSPFASLAREYKGYFSYQIGEDTAVYERQQEAVNNLRQLYHHADSSQGQKTRIRQFLISVGESVIIDDDS